MRVFPRVLVVGGGAAGLGSALALARGGCRVRLICRAPPQASRVAAGMLGPLSEAALECSRAYPSALRLGLLGLTRWREEANAVGVSLRFGCRLLLSPEILERAWRLAHDIGWSPQEGGGGLWLPEEACLDPVAALHQLKAAFIAAGGECTSGDATEPLWRGGRVCGVRLSNGDAIASDGVVLAPGFHPTATAWLAAAPALAHLQPARGTILRFSGASRQSDSVVRSPGVYLVPRADGDVLAGASMEFGQVEPSPSPAEAARLSHAAIALSPDLERTAWTAEAGIRAMSPDWAPLLGPAAAPGLFLAAGMGRNGWLLSMVTGDIISAYVLERPIPPLYGAFAPHRFDPS